MAAANAVLLSLVVAIGTLTPVVSAQSDQGSTHRATSMEASKHVERDGYENSKDEKKTAQATSNQLKRLVNSLSHLQKVRANIEKSHMNPVRKTYMLARLDRLIAVTQQKIARLNVPGTDTLAPVTSAWKVTNITDTTAKLTVKVNETAIGYYVVTSSGSTVPSVSQVKSGQDSSGQIAAIRGSGAIVSGKADYVISGLAPAAGYTAYFVAEDFFHNVQTTVSSVSWMTLVQPDVIPPVTSAASFSGTTSTGTTLSFTSSETGSLYYVALPSASAVPSSAQIILGQDGSGQVAIHGSGAIVSGANVLGISGLTAMTSYVVYFMTTDTAGNIEILTHALVVTTTN